MELITRLLLTLHVASGVVALISALIAISAKKGRRVHNWAGRIYFGAMLSVAITAIPVAIIRPNAMLFMLALFSTYMAYVGWRFGREARLNTEGRPIVERLMVLVGSGMVAWGFLEVVSGEPMGWAQVAFGGIALQMAIQDLRVKRLKLEFANRIAAHLQHMLGGTIATVTAVLVQQVVSRMETGDPWAVAVWLAPTIVINPLIFVWSRKVLTSNKTKLFS
jgi:uncharacterized membrane protein